MPNCRLFVGGTAVWNNNKGRWVWIDFWKGLCVSLVLLHAGDVKVNPGPVGGKYPCVVCGKAVRNNHLGIECSRCEKWTHAVCGGVSPGKYLRLSLPKFVNEHWHCPVCQVGLSFCDASINSSSTSLGSALNGNISRLEARPNVVVFCNMNTYITLLIYAVIWGSAPFTLLIDVVISGGVRSHCWFMQWYRETSRSHCWFMQWYREVLHSHCWFMQWYREVLRSHCWFMQWYREVLCSHCWFMQFYRGRAPFT